VLLKSYFPAAFLVAIILLVLDATTPSVAAQVRTVTVTETVRVLVTVTGFVTVTQQVYLTLERTVMVTVATGIPTTLTSVITSVVRSILTETLVVSRLMTETSLVSRVMTETSVMSAMVTTTAPIRIGPFSLGPVQIGPFLLDLADAGGLRFLAFPGAVALTGFIGGALTARPRHREAQRYEVLQPELPRAAPKLPRWEIEVLRGKYLSGVPERILFEEGDLGWYGIRARNMPGTELYSYWWVPLTFLCVPPLWPPGVLPPGWPWPWAPTYVCYGV